MTTQAHITAWWLCRYRLYSLSYGDSVWHHWFGSTLIQQRLVTCSVPSNHRKQCWIIASWGIRNIFSDKLVKIQRFYISKMHLKMLSAKRGPFCAGLSGKVVSVTARFVTRFNLWLRHDLWPHNASICDPARFVTKSASICDQRYTMII